MPSRIAKAGIVGSPPQPQHLLLAQPLRCNFLGESASIQVGIILEAIVRPTDHKAYVIVCEN
jgi:hypothetical protein